MAALLFVPAGFLVELGAADVSPGRVRANADKTTLRAASGAGFGSFSSWCFLLSRSEPTASISSASLRVGQSNPERAEDRQGSKKEPHDSPLIVDVVGD